jgi:hypothetical protein
MSQFLIYPETLQRMRTEYAFDQLSGILAKQATDRSELESVLVTAIRWLGRASAALEPPEELLMIAIALERLLASDEEEWGGAAISEKVPRRASFLLSDEQAERKRIFGRTKELYNLRSRVVHAGSIRIEERDLVDMEAYARDCLLRLVPRLGHWEKQRQFTDWVEEQIFA